jgi:hypothetical protein
MENPGRNNRQCDNRTMTPNRRLESIQERSACMKTSSPWNYYRPLVGKIMMGLVLAAMIGGIDVMPALGKDDHNRDSGRYEQRGRGHARGHYVKGRPVYRPYGYRERVYIQPPPVIYAPPPPPGISIWFPPIIIPLR